VQCSRFIVNLIMKKHEAMGGAQSPARVVRVNTSARMRPHGNVVWLPGLKIPVWGSIRRVVIVFYDPLFTTKARAGHGTLSISALDC